MTPGYVIREGYEPRAQVSPSAIKLARMCERAHGYRYILGYKEPEVTWEQIKDQPKPTNKEELKAWNRLRRPALGKAVHALLEDWYAGRDVDWHGVPGRILLPALRHFPHPSEFAAITEEKVADDFVAAMTDGDHNYEFNAYIDVNGIDRAQPRLRTLDLKTTSSFDWMAKPSDLIEDTQGIIYPLYTMWRNNQRFSENRWVYALTEGTAPARPVDFTSEYGTTHKRALKIFDEGAILVRRINERADPNSLTPNTGACDMYHRKCIYHHSVGGPCKAESSPGKMARALIARGPTQERTIMAFKDKLKTAQGHTSGEEQPAGNEEPKGEVTPPADPVEPNPVVHPRDTDEARKVQPTAQPKRSPKTATATKGVVTVTFDDGFSLALPESSPLNAKLAAIHAAIHGE